eukprot:Awhi_evm2s1182
MSDSSTMLGDVSFKFGSKFRATVADPHFNRSQGSNGVIHLNREFFRRGFRVFQEYRFHSIVHSDSNVTIIFRSSR